MSSQTKLVPSDSRSQQAVCQWGMGTRLELSICVSVSHMQLDLSIHKKKLSKGLLASSEPDSLP